MPISLAQQQASYRHHWTVCFLWLFSNLITDGWVTWKMRWWHRDHHPFFSSILLLANVKSLGTGSPPAFWRSGSTVFTLVKSLFIFPLRYKRKKKKEEKTTPDYIPVASSSLPKGSLNTKRNGMVTNVEKDPKRNVFFSLFFFNN